MLRWTGASVHVAFGRRVASIVVFAYYPQATGEATPDEGGRGVSDGTGTAPCA